MRVWAHKKVLLVEVFDMRLQIPHDMHTYTRTEYCVRTSTYNAVFIC